MKEKKTIVNMTDWELYVHDEHYNLSGIADHHPRLGNNTYVGRTSSLVSYTYEDEILTYETKNTIYVCPLKYMTIRPYANVTIKYIEKLANRTETANSPLDKIIEASARISLLWDLEHSAETEWLRADDERTLTDVEVLKDDFVNRILEIQEEGQKEIQKIDEMESARLIEIAEKYEDCIYLEVSCVASGDKLAYHLGKYTGAIEPSVHVGMFQDSVLYMKYRQEEDDCALDFRYFPKGLNDEMETYSWSDNISQAIIKNACSYTLKFNGELIEPEQTKVIKPDTHTQGLVSPDCYNGKSVFHIIKESE